jgi:DNA-binding MarR family transcriptional regulator
VSKSPELRAFAENMSTVKRVLRQASAEAYGDFALGDTQMKILRYVAANPRASQADLARATETDPALLGRALKGMLDRGVLKRSRSKEDRRAYLIELGPSGAALATRVEAASARLVQRILAPFDARDLADFDRLTKKLVAALGKKA